jgi:hypothetical protein
MRARQHDERARRVAGTAPSSCVSSPRITSGVPAASRVDSPGTIAISPPSVSTSRATAVERRRARDVRRLAPALAAADHAARDARRGSSRQSPTSRSSAART